MLRKLRPALGHRLELCLTGVVEVGETYVGGATTGGKRERGAGNKSSVAEAVEHRASSVGSLRLADAPSASGEEPGAFVRGRMDTRQATMLTGGCQASEHLTSSRVKHGMPQELVN
jgi:hypothetical protein